MQDIACDTTSNMPLSPFANTFKHASTGSSNKSGPKNSRSLPRSNLKARSYRAPKLAEDSRIKKTQKKQGGGGMSQLLKALNLLEQLKDVTDDSCAMLINQLEELIGQRMVRETRASRASLTSYNSDWDIASEDHSVPSFSTCGNSTSNSNFSICSQNDSSITFPPSDQSADDLDPMDTRMDMETPRAQPSTSIVYHCTFLLNEERCRFSAKYQVDWIKHEESEKHYPQKRYMCIMCIDLIDYEEGNSLCAFCFAQLPAGGNNKTHYLQCQAAQKGKHIIFNAARKDHFRNHLKKHCMLDITDEASTWIFNIESNWPRECGFCATIFETWEERKHHVANHFQQGMDISSWKLPIRKRKRLGDTRPGISRRRDDDDDDDDDEDDQNYRPSTRTPGNWTSLQASHREPQASFYMISDWTGWGEVASFDAERSETSGREKVEAHLSHLRQLAGGANETSVNNRYLAERVHRLVIALSNNGIMSPFGEVTLNFNTSSPQATELPMLCERIPRLRDIFSFRRPDIIKPQFALTFARQSRHMFDSTKSYYLTKSPREHLQPFLTCDECKEVHSCDRKELWAKHEGECHGLLRGWICGIDDCEHMCYGKIGLLEHLFSEHRLRRLMQKVIVIVRQSSSLFDHAESTPNSGMAIRQLDVLRQYLIDRYHYAMEKKALRVQSSLKNGPLATTWDQRHLFPFGSTTKLLQFLDTRFGPRRSENIPQPFRGLLKYANVTDSLDFYIGGQQWKTGVTQKIPPMRQQEIEKAQILSVVSEDETADATTIPLETITLCGKDQEKVVATLGEPLSSVIGDLSHLASKPTELKSTSRASPPQTRRRAADASGKPETSSTQGTQNQRQEFRQGLVFLLSALPDPQEPTTLNKSLRISSDPSSFDRVGFLYLNDTNDAKSTIGAMSRTSFAAKPPLWDTMSCATSVSDTESASSASTAPPLNCTPPWHEGQPLNYTYDLPCEFSIIGCSLQFHPERFESWISHTQSHFVGVSPPPRAICTFCDDHNGVFENSSDPTANWRARMLHIGAHYAGGMQYEQLRPDYFVIDYMWQNGLLSPRDYEQAINYTERKRVDGLVAVGHKTKEMGRKEERSLEQRHNLDREKRQIKREKGTSKRMEKERGKDKGKDTRQSSQKYSETKCSPTSSSRSKNAV